MPQNWKTYKLGEVIELKRGYDLPSRVRVKGDFNVISSSGISDTHNSYKVEGPGVVTGRYGTIGEVFFTKEKFWPLNTSLYVRDFKENDPKFIYYLLKTINWTSYSTKSAVPGIDRNEVHQADVTIPESLPEQRAIASILSSLDDKIELNLQMNKTLEEMAMTLYRHWFVDFEFPVNSPPLEGSAQQGVVNSPPLEGWIQPKAEDGVVRNTTNYMSLPYNPKLKERAKALRKAGNLAEVLFWQQVHKKQFMGLDFDRQKIIGNYIVDFYCANVNVVVEIDGSSHDNKHDYDAARDAYLEGLGLTVIHITDEAVKKDLAQTMEDLKAHPAFNSPPPEGWSKTGVVNSPPLEGWISSEMKDGVVLSRLQQQSPQGEVNSPPLEQSPQGEVVNNHPAFQGGVNNHPAFQAPLQGRGRGSAEVKGYKSSGGKFIDSELGPIPEGWEVKRLGDVIETLGGGTPKTTVDEYWENGTIDWYSPTDLTKANSLYSLGTAKKITELGLKKSSSKLFPKGSLLMSSRATIGAITINRKEACTNQGFITMIPNEKVSLYQLHGWTVANMDLIISKANGSTFKEISKSNFRDLLITVGVELDEYLRSVESIYSQIENNILENQTLTSLRDTLLPKLISGEVRVKDVESQVAEVL